MNLDELTRASGEWLRGSGPESDIVISSRIRLARNLSSFPFTIFGTFIRRFFTFVVPAAFVAYLPTLALLGRSDPAGLPTWLSWSALPVSLLAAAAAWWIWRLGLRHYVGAGS